jgi:glyoxylase-like metal-dependent hydrolase (beta-lactamase superfamily II)
LDIASPSERVGQKAIDAAGFQFHEDLTAIRQIEQLGFQASDVTDIVLTHADHDHVGGLADFPSARVHISEEEYSQVVSGHPRYSAEQFSHEPRWVLYAPSSARWFGMEARPLDLFNDVEIHLVPLFGHTMGHCGVALFAGGRWLLHVGDAYYLRVELTADDHPVSALTKHVSEDNELRLVSLRLLRRLAQEHESEVEMFGYHDFNEVPTEKQPKQKSGPRD